MPPARETPAMAFFRFTVLLLGPEAFAPVHPDGPTLCSQSKTAPCVRCARAVRGVNPLLNSSFRSPDWARRAPLIRALFDSPSPITTPGPEWTA
jgi:hypothetical protein